MLGQIAKNCRPWGELTLENFTGDSGGRDPLPVGGRSSRDNVSRSYPNPCELLKRGGQRKLLVKSILGIWDW